MKNKNLLTGADYLEEALMMLRNDDGGEFSYSDAVDWLDENGIELTDAEYEVLEKEWKEVSTRNGENDVRFLVVEYVPCDNIREELEYFDTKEEAEREVKRLMEEDYNNGRDDGAFYAVETEYYNKEKEEMEALEGLANYMILLEKRKNFINNLPNGDELEEWQVVELAILSGTFNIDDARKLLKDGVYTCVITFLYNPHEIVFIFNLAQGGYQVFTSRHPIKGGR